MAAMAASLLYHVLSVRDDYLSSLDEGLTSAWLLSLDILWRSSPVLSHWPYLLIASPYSLPKWTIFINKLLKPKAGITI